MGTLWALAASFLAATTLVRVGLLDGATFVDFAVATGSAAVGADSAAEALNATEPWRALPAAGRIDLVAPAGATRSLIPPIRVVPPAGAPVMVAGRWYRGALEFRLAPEGGLIAINELPLEEYLFGVVPGEMPPAWPLEALEAQAVAARTYTMTRLGSRRERGYDVKPTVEDQVYGGLAVEAATSSLAIAWTRGQVLMYAGVPIQAYYCAGAGGFTEAAEAVHGFERVEPGHPPGGYPYLRAVPDFDWDSPRWLWTVDLAPEDLAARLEARGLGVGEVRAVEVVERSFSGRARRLRVEGERASRELTGPQFRFALGLNSTLFSISGGPDGHFHIVGRGWGHGVGMSQWGARKLAEWGFDHEGILGHYYPGAELEFVLP